MRTLNALERAGYERLDCLLSEAVSIASIRLEEPSQEVEHLIEFAQLQIERIETLKRSDFDVFPIELLILEENSFLALCRMLIREFKKLDPSVVAIL
jgi:hypothetical protein